MLAIVASPADTDRMTPDPLLSLLAEIAEAAGEVAFEHQPPRLKDALATLSLTESRLVASLLEPAQAGPSSDSF